MRISERQAQRAVFVFAVAYLLPKQTHGQDPLGQVDCPCVSATWTDFTVLTGFVTGASYPSGYGMEGCKPYDSIYNTSGCGGAGEQPAFCQNSWCYVDPVACGVNTTKCWNAGLMMNNPSNPACRGRSMDKSDVLPQAAPAYYSYQTCGSLNDYDISRHQNNMRGTEIIAITTHDLPYTTRTETPGNDGNPIVEFGGVQVDFMNKVLGHFQPAPAMKMVDGWATPGSRAKFSSSFTAAVHDVALGNFDIAIADFWVTSERMLLTNFLPAVRSDNFYLLVYKSGGSTSFEDMLKNPFKPFTGQAWAIIVAAVVVSASAMAIVDFHDDDEFPYQHSGPLSLIARAGKSMYLGMGSLMSGGSMYSASSMSAKIMTLGFQLFLVITMASYTANLASILVVANVATGVNSINDAIDIGMTVCVPVAVERTVTVNYPALKAHFFGGSTTDFVRLMHAGVCDGTIIHLKRIEQMHAGEIQQIDCKAVEDGDLTEEEAMCVNGRGGTPRNDCDIIRVGDSIFNVPVAFPIRPGDANLLTALSWAMTDAQRSGEWESEVVKNAALFPKSRCSTAAVSSAQLDWDAFAGACFFALAAAMLAIIIHFSKSHASSRAPKGEADDAAVDAAEGVDEDEEGVPRATTKGEGFAAQASLEFAKGSAASGGAGGGASTEAGAQDKKLDSILAKLEGLEKSLKEGTANGFPAASKGQADDNPGQSDSGNGNGNKEVAWSDWLSTSLGQAPSKT